MGLERGTKKKINGNCNNAVLKNSKANMTKLTSVNSGSSYSYVDYFVKLLQDICLHV